MSEIVNIRKNHQKKICCNQKYLNDLDQTISENTTDCFNYLFIPNINILYFLSFQYLHDNK